MANYYRFAEKELILKVFFEIGGKHRKAFALYQKSAEQGNANAQCQLGYMYENGYGVPKDYWKACELYQAAANQRDATAQFNLGVIYEKGLGVPKNMDKAKEYYRLAANQDNEKAIQHLKRLGLI